VIAGIELSGLVAGISTPSLTCVDVSEDADFKVHRLSQPYLSRSMMFASHGFTGDGLQ